VAHLQKKIERLSSDLHDLSHQLHPAKLDKLGLLPTVRGYIREMKKMYEFSVELAEEDFPDALPNDLAICLFRIIQEAVWNARKYSQVDRAFIQLKGNFDNVCLTIYDCGAGFDMDTSQKPAGIGIMGMEERARLFGGTCTVFSRSGGGTYIEVVIPLPPAGPQE
jgi:signal transduction histidine kinase